MTDSKAGQYHIELARNNEIPNKDFVLEYKLAGQQTQAAVLTARAEDGAGYFLLLAVPPLDYVMSDIQPKDITFIIDTSGSMSGSKIVQAKNALRSLVRGLNPQDSFNIVRFSSDFSSFSTSPVPFTQENVDRADAFIDALRADGGTEMLPPLLQALKQPRDERRLPIIVFLTDAQVGNEAQILKAIRENLGIARLYSLGVDVAPNDYLLRKMAELGRGTVEFVLPSQNLEDVLARFQNRIASPVLTDVRIEGIATDDLYPSPAPDLFLAKPIVLLGRVPHPGQHTITVRGMNVAGPLRLPVRADFNRPTADPATLATLWARARIDALSDRLYMKPDDESTKQEITELALHHKLMSPFTSLVAIEEKTIASPDGGPPKTVVVPVPLPEGWDYEAIFGREKKEAGKFRLMQAQAPANTPQYDAFSGAVGGIAHRSAPAGPRSATTGRGRAESYPAEPSVSFMTKEDRLQAMARYLVRQQRVDGLWSDGPKQSINDIETTAIALLAYVGGGHTDRAGHYQAQVRRALDQLMRSIDSSGMLKGVSNADDQVQAQALALWALAESYAATHNSRHQAAAMNLQTALLQHRTSQGLWPARAGGAAHAETSAWAVLALKSCLQAGLATDPKALLTAARAIESLPQASPIAKSVIQLLAGRGLSPDLRQQVMTSLTQNAWTINDSSSVESATLALIAARLLDTLTLNRTETHLLKAVADKQQTQGKAVGSVSFEAGTTVSTSARAYLLLSAAEAPWTALQ
jgi:hypothetical protein